jgi:5-methylcytosine-specific restriction endonuclease McrA
VADIEKKRFGKTSRSGKGKSSSESRRVPNAVKRQVFERDKGQCTFEDAEGHRCSNRAVEFDHALPHAFGGQTTFDNLRLRCRAHNLLAAEEFFGKALIQSHQTDLPGP